MEPKPFDLGIGRERFDEGIHLCYIYSDDEERTRTMARFLGKGLGDGEKVLCIVDSHAPHPIEAELEKSGALDAKTRPAFATSDNEVSYCPGGDFDPDALLAGVGDFCRQAESEGFSGSRISGDMSWLLRTDTPREAVLEYEVKVTEYLKSTPFVAICEYDARRFDGALLMEILRVHPAIIAGGQVVLNPYYEHPERALERERTRDARVASD